MLLFFFLIGIYHIPALWFIAFYIAIDHVQPVRGAASGDRNDVANAAHLGGYALRILDGDSLLLAVGVLARTDLDALFLFKQYAPSARRCGRRAGSTEAVSTPRRPTTATLLGASPRRSGPTAVPELVPVAPDEHAEDRRTITEALPDATTSAAAVEAYRAASGEAPTGRRRSGGDRQPGDGPLGDAETAVRAYTGPARATR